MDVTTWVADRVLDPGLLIYEVFVKNQTSS